MSCYMTTKHSFRTVEPFHNNDRHPQNAINLEIKNTQKQTCSQLFITFQHEKPFNHFAMLYPQLRRYIVQQTFNYVRNRKYLVIKLFVRVAF